MKYIAIVTILSLVGLAGACASSPETTTKTTNAVATNTATNAASNAATTNAAPKSDNDAPASVKAVFPDAQSFTTQHKDIPADKIASIEKDTDSKVPDKDHHSYLAFSTAGGARKQVGAATIVKVEGRDVIVVYDNKDGSPIIKEVRADGVPAPFLAQFAGKGHDNDLLLGADIKASGANEAQAKAITEAVRVDVLTMQALYGSAHKH
ncbi:MAG: hypothetical protein M3525_13390 [Acidobacteriota bacterium]|jgi:Cu/Ag efflux protein CusF|nr:hypothetical protein [Acidobacteriota bacterium]